MYHNLYIRVSMYVNRSSKAINQNVDMYLHISQALYKHDCGEAG